jgi:hypothetical protein
LYPGLVVIAVFAFVWFFYTILTYLVYMFMYIWFGIGSRWVFNAHTSVQHTDPSLDTYCDRTLYLYSFWYTIAVYITIFLYCNCCCFSVVVSGAILQKDVSFEPDDQVSAESGNSITVAAPTLFEQEN